MPTTRTHATLRISPREPGAGSAAAVTAALGIAPTKAHEAGDAKSDRDSRTWANAMWLLESSLSWNESLSAHLEQLCQAVDPHREALLRLAHEGYQIDCFCFVEVKKGQGGVALASNVLTVLGRLGVPLDLDIYASADDE